MSVIGYLTTDGLTELLNRSPSGADEAGVTPVGLTPIKVAAQIRTAPTKGGHVTGTGAGKAVAALGCRPAQYSVGRAEGGKCPVHRQPRRASLTAHVPEAVRMSCLVGRQRPQIKAVASRYDAACALALNDASARERPEGHVLVEPNVRVMDPGAPPRTP